MEGIEGSGISDYSIIIRAGEESNRWRTGIILISIHNHFTFEIELHLVR